MKKNMKRFMVLMLVFAMVMSLVGCGQEAPIKVAGEVIPQIMEEEITKPQAEATTTTNYDIAQAIQISVDMQNATQQMELTAPTEYDRESMVQIAEMLGVSGDAVQDMDDEEILNMVEDLLEQTNGQNQGSSKPNKADKPSVDVEDNSENYEEDGSLKKPFDQIYPELLAEGAVEYDDETLLIKMSNCHKGEITKAMSEAGISLLEAIVPMEKSTWYEAKLFPGADAMSAVKMLRDLDEVQSVDFNYEVATNGMPDAEAIPEELEMNPKLNKQWYLKYCQYPKGHGQLKKEGGDSSVIVAVIDTGVDYDHEDLAQNIWKNTAEIPDNGYDDDHNGYTDDYYGVNIITGQGNGDDDNGHGTHVAGIIAAQNNKIGIVGLAYNVKIMPIKAAMSSGALLQSDIAKAVLYAYEHGAQVINMSFGGGASSIAVQDALEVAYSRCVLVASAGNDGYINEAVGPFDLPKPSYPAALNYVVGVMSVGESGIESGFTNYDGALYTKTEYEVYAPGEGIISTIPNDQYASWSGTSMAAPIVSAIAAIVRSEYADLNTYPTKFIYGQLTATSENQAICLDPTLHGKHNVPNIINLYEALTKMPTPDVGLFDCALFDTEGLTNDTIGKNNGDGVIDAGETIALGLTLRNRWGKSVNTMVSIDALSPAGIADPYIEIINPEVNYGEVGTYSTADCGAIYTDELLTGWENPFYIRIAEDCPNDYIFRLNVTIKAQNGLDEEDKNEYIQKGFADLTVRSGEILPSVIEDDMVLTADSLYIIPNGTTIQPGVTVTVEPGTHIQFWSNDASDPYADKYIAGLDVKGRFLVKGTKEDPVYIYPSELMAEYNVNIYESETGYVSLEYADITNLRIGWDRTISYCKNSIFRQNFEEVRYRYLNNGSVYSATASELGNYKQAINCVFYKNGNAGNWIDNIQGTFEKSLFVDCGIQFRSETRFIDCVFNGNNFTGDIANAKDGVSSFAIYNLIYDDYKDIQNTKVYYNTESGVTYVLYKASPYNETVTYKNEFFYQLIQALGGDHLIIETKAEKAWIDKYGPYEALELNVIYDVETDTYLWSDGTIIEDFVDPDAVTKSGYQNDKIKYYGEKISYRGDYWTSVLYEIPGVIYPEDIQFREYSVNLDMETVYQIIPTTVPETDVFIYGSLDESIATVSQTGLVTPTGVGTTDIYVYSFDKAVYNYITVNVTDYVALERIAFTETNIVLEQGDHYAIRPVYAPTNTTRKHVTYTSSDESVAIVDEKGVVTAVGRGDAVITAVAEGKTAAISVNVRNLASSVDISKSILVVSLSDQKILLPEVYVEGSEEYALQWESSDKEIAVIEGNELVLKSEGTSSIIVTDIYSGKSDAVLLYAVEGQVPVIKETNGYGNNAFSLTETGDVLVWNNSWGGDKAEKILENVIDFEHTENNVIFLKEDGTIYVGYASDRQPYLLTEFFCGKNPEQVEILYGSYFVRTADGSVYGWGENTYGILGLGHKERVANPTLLNLEKVIDFEVDSASGSCLFLNSKGELYATGGDKNQYMSPKYVSSDVSSIVGAWYAFYVVGRNTVEFYDGRISSWDADLSTYELLANTDVGLVGVKDGIMYRVSTGEALSTDSKVTAISSLGSPYLHVATEDGMLYLFDGEKFAKIDTISFENDIIRMGGNNLNEYKELLDEKLIIKFNKAIVNHKIALFADGVQIPVSVIINQNEMKISLANGFQKNVNYCLEILENGLSCVAGSTNENAIVLEFTSEYVDVNSKTEENIIHETQRDESIERFYWTQESLAAEMCKICEEKQINSQFKGNVVLNRISTDVNPEHWFRVLAPSTATYMEIPLGGNYWGTTNATAVGKQIVDFNDYNSYARLMYENYLTEAPEDTFPFVTDVTILNKNGEEVSTVGNEEITVCVAFNRDMDTSIPLKVTFGSSYPYADYIIEGEYADARTWKGEYTLSTLIEGGTNYFNISNGCSATEELDFYHDIARFSFDIDNTAAQALLMQGYATDTGVQLSWTQDDFDTLMGYNVYRSTSEDGFYQRINTTVIPADTKEFFDNTVEPGVLYYYNFTVVQTDMNESIPSGKITIMSKDTMAPDIYHTPVYNGFTGSNLLISATVTDNLNLTSVKVFYRVAGTKAWNVSMMSKLNDKYSAIIPASSLSLDGMEYYIEAYDGINYTYRGSAANPYSVIIQQAIDASSLGDVNGDGKISNLDALMLLQAINDKLNLTNEQFKRADLDGNGILQAFEALRILQYINGKVGSVVIS